MTIKKPNDLMSQPISVAPGTREVMAMNSMKYTSPSFTECSCDRLPCSETVRHMFLDQCMFDISAGEQRITGISVVQCVCMYG